MSPPDPGICLVLGAGGFRGLAHVGVLRGLQKLSLGVESMIGVSIGGLVASFHAGLGYPPEEMERRLSHLTTASLFALGWSLHASRAGSPDSASSQLRADLEALRRLSLDGLHFGIRRLGLLALDLFTGEEVFVSTGRDGPVAPWDVAVGGASIPGLFPWVRRKVPGRTYRLVDGGFSHSVPVERALEPPFAARKILAVDLGVIRGFRERDPLRWENLQREHPGRVIRLKPRVSDAGTIFFRAAQAPELIRCGEEAVLEQAQALC